MINRAILFGLLIAPAIAEPLAEPFAESDKRPEHYKPCKQALNCLYNYGGESFVTSYCGTDRITKTEKVYDLRGQLEWSVC